MDDENESSATQEEDMPSRQGGDGPSWIDDSGILRLRLGELGLQRGRGFHSRSHRPGVLLGWIYFEDEVG